MQIPDVPPQLLAALVEAAAGQRLALVGGVVRDLLLHRHHQDPWRGLPDLDLVVEGQAADLVARLPAALEHQFGTAIPLRQQPHGRYGTVELELQLPQDLGGSWLVDLASARREVYPEPATQPLVTPGTLEQDLARRDFTVNAMALEFRPGDPDQAVLLDPHGGRQALERRELQLLHAHSFQDDPTRLVRAARYSARLGFELSDETKRQIARTLKDWPWRWTFYDRPHLAPPALASRLRMELELLMEREPWHQAIHAFSRWGGLQLLVPQDRGLVNVIHRLQWSHHFRMPRLLFLVVNCAEPFALAARLRLPQRQCRWIDQMLMLRDQLAGSALPKSPSSWSALLEQPGLSAESIALYVAQGGRPRRELLRWFFRWRHVRAPITGHELMVVEGLSPGPRLRQRLHELRNKVLDQTS